MGIAKIEHLERNSAARPQLIVDRRQDSGYDVINAGIVTTSRTVAKNGHGLAGLNQCSELAYGKIWALTRSINREETEANYRKGKKMRISVAKHFSRELGSSVHGDWPELDLVFGKGNPTGCAIYRAGRTEEKFAHGELTAGLKQIEGTCHVDLLIQVRLFNRRTHTGARRQVDHYVRACALQALSQGNRVTDVGWKELIAANAADVFQIGLLPGRRIEFV